MKYKKPTWELYELLEDMDVITASSLVNDDNPDQEIPNGGWGD